MERLFWPTSVTSAESIRVRTTTAEESVRTVLSQNAKPLLTWIHKPAIGCLIYSSHSLALRKEADRKRKPWCKWAGDHPPLRIHNRAKLLKGPINCKPQRWVMKVLFSFKPQARFHHRKLLRNFFRNPGWLEPHFHFQLAWTRNFWGGASCAGYHWLVQHKPHRMASTHTRHFINLHLAKKQRWCWFYIGSTMEHLHDTSLGL